MSERLQIPEGLGQIAPRYEALLCDVWGVIHNGREVMDAAVQALMRFRKAGGLVVLLSNSPRPGEDIPSQFEALGLQNICWDTIITSGDATRGLLRARAPGPAFWLGPKRDEGLFRGTGLAFAPLDEARFIACTGLVDDRRETPDDYRALLQQAAQAGLPMICANPDTMVQFGSRLIYCGGALAEAYAQLGGAVIYGGKPHAPIYALALEFLAKQRGRPVPREHILAIGDGPDTDVAGAAAQAIDCLFISGGLASGQMGTNDPVQAAARLLLARNTRARFVLPNLRW